MYMNSVGRKHFVNITNDFVGKRFPGLNDCTAHIFNDFKKNKNWDEVGALERPFEKLNVSLSYSFQNPTVVSTF